MLFSSQTSCMGPTNIVILKITESFHQAGMVKLWDRNQIRNPAPNLIIQMDMICIRLCMYTYTHTYTGMVDIILSYMQKLTDFTFSDLN